jgi:hypothetical protein
MPCICGSISGIEMELSYRNPSACWHSILKLSADMTIDKAYCDCDSGKIVLWQWACLESGPQTAPQTHHIRRGPTRSDGYRRQACSNPLLPSVPSRETHQRKNWNTESTATDRNGEWIVNNCKATVTRHVQDKRDIRINTQVLWSRESERNTGRTKAL